MKNYAMIAVASALAGCSPSGKSQTSTTNEASVQVPLASSVPTQELTVEGLTIRQSSPYTTQFCEAVARLRNTGKVPVETPDFTIQYELAGQIVGTEDGLVERSIPVGGTAPLLMKHYCPPKGAKASDLSAVTFYDKQSIRVIMKR